MWKVLQHPPFRNHDLLKSDLDIHNQLRRAIQRKDKKFVKDILQKGAFVNSILQNVPDVGEYQTPLHLAVVSRCPEILKMLLDHGASGDDRNLNGESPLIVAAKMQNTALMDLLLSYKLQNFEDYQDFSHLHIACIRGNIGALRKLLHKSLGENLNKAVRDTSMYWPGFTPLHFAVHFEQIETVKVLLDYGADITIKDRRKLTPLHLADMQRNEVIIDLLLAAHRYVFTNPSNDEGLSHFHIACTRDNTSTVKHFLNFGVDINLKADREWKSIHYAMYYECSNVIDLLSSYRMDMNVSILSPYFSCMAFKRTSILQNQIIEKLSSVTTAGLNNALDQPDKFSDFHIHCIQNNAEKILQLISNQVVSATSDLNQPVIDGYTSLHLAIRSNSANSAKVLLSHGADFMLRDDEGCTALHTAFELEFTRVLDTILFVNMNNQTPNLIDNKGLSVFHILCSRGDDDTIDDFIRRGVDINMQVGPQSMRWAGWTPLHFAIESLRREVIDVLLEHGANGAIATASGLNSVDFALQCMENTKRHYNDYLEIVHQILSAIPAGSQNFDHGKISLLHVACTIYGDDLEDLQKHLVKYRDYINKPLESAESPSLDGKTPLELAICHGNFQQAKLLIENGADIFQVNDCGGTPLEYAFSDELIRYKSVDDVESLFSIAMASMDKFKPSYFYVACVLGLLNVVRGILHNITDENLKINFVDCRNDAGQTPLHLMFKRRNIDETAKKQIIELLLESGADVNARDNMLIQTPLHYMEKAAEIDVTRKLLSHGADVNAQDIFGETPLHKIYVDVFERFDRNITDRTSFCKQITLLLEAGSNINIVDMKARTCFTMIESHYNGLRMSDGLTLDISRILLEHVKKLQLIGFHVCRINEQAFVNVSQSVTTYDDAVFGRSCQEELELMMSVKIDYRTTLHDILFKSLDEMAFYSENVILQEIVASDDFVKYSNYGYLVKLCIKNGQMRRLLLKNSAKCLPILIDKVLPLECLEKILRYLSDSDLKNIISSKP